jgi:hypothetical protein
MSEDLHATLSQQGMTATMPQPPVMSAHLVQGPPAPAPVVILTQAEYDGLPGKDPDILYVIVN